MSLIVQIKGTKEFEMRINRLKKEFRKQSYIGLVDGCARVHSTAVKLIAKPSAGRRVTRYNPKRSHVTSKPGDAPNTDTGRLIGSLKFRVNKDKLEGFVSAGAKYARYLEFGTRDMRARPFLRPALGKNTDFLRKLFDGQVRKAVLKAFSKG